MNILSFFDEHWAVLVGTGGFIFSIFASYLWLQWQQKATALTIIEIKERETENSKDIAEVKDRLGKIEAGVSYIQSEITFIKDLFVKVMDKA